MFDDALGCRERFWLVERVAHPLAYFGVREVACRRAGVKKNYSARDV